MFYCARITPSLCTNEEREIETWAEQDYYSPSDFRGFQAGIWERQEILTT